ncbi:MAG TPA: methyltransferase domain-containing protein [Gemmataceae bacterium]|jgi:ubiquinone/menaquinone biosynthesis C-methylase UbiE|nr:methyltransferase domain-containing protein [Gemmataceae bacterium]
MPSEIDAVRQQYDRLATKYDRRWRSYVDATLQAVADCIPIRGQERVLDVACGTGELERLLLARWPALQVAGTDLSRGMLCQAVTKEGNRRASWVQAEATRLPFPDHAFDSAICANSFHYFRSPMKALAEVHRVLHEHGWFVLVDWCDDYLTCKLCSLWLRLTDPAFCRAYRMSACRSLLEDAGFTVVQAERFRVGWLWGMMRFLCRRNTC